MCGILCILECHNTQETRARAVQLAKRLRHRGPDWSGVWVSGNKVMCHERLAIVDPESGDQPLPNEDGTIAVCVNGEIYNHKELEAELKQPHTFRTKSDCECIVHLYEECGADLVNRLSGDFGFVVADTVKDTFLVARDPMGVDPLYYGYGRDGAMWFASEMKALKDDCERFDIFPPGQYYTPETGFVQWYVPPWHDEKYLPSTAVDLVALRNAFEQSVLRRLMSDVPYGVLLSGGLDSSLVAAVAARNARKRVEEGQKSEAWWPRLHSFCIGMKGSPDIAAAREVANFLDLVHHEYTFTFQEGLDAIPDVIHHLETYDLTTVRASTPMYLMARKIKASGIKMVLSGEGADEIFGGYLYFHKAPNAEEFHKETVNKLKGLHYYDCLRANKSMCAWGVEVRVPFLDRDFLEVAMNMDPAAKMCGGGKIEKSVLRAAFDTLDDPYLPKEILWRQKEQFSDGVGYTWIDGLKATASTKVSDRMMEKAAFVFPHNTPASKEAYWYRMLFADHFPGQSAANTVPGGPSIACSTPAAIAWDAAFASMADPSGRAVAGVHTAADGFKMTRDATEAAATAPSSS